MNNKTASIKLGFIISSSILMTSAAFGNVCGSSYASNYIESRCYNWNPFGDCFSTAHSVPIYCLPTTKESKCLQGTTPTANVQTIGQADCSF